MAQSDARRRANATARLFAESIHVSATLLVGAAAMAASRERLPIRDQRLRTLVAAAVGLAAGTAADALLTALPNQWPQPYALPAYASTPTAWPAPDCDADTRHQLSQAITEGAAPRAAAHAHTLDPSLGRHYLGSPDRWHGYPDGSAAFYLGSGHFLRCTFTDAAYGPRATYTLVRSTNPECVEIHTLQQLQEIIDPQPTGTSQPDASPVPETNPDPAGEPPHPAPADAGSASPSRTEAAPADSLPA